MQIDLFLTVVIGLTLFGLAHYTETILEIRQRRRDQGDDPKVYL